MNGSTTERIYHYIGNIIRKTYIYILFVGDADTPSNQPECTVAWQEWVYSTHFRWWIRASSTGCHETTWRISCDNIILCESYIVCIRV